MIGVIYSLTKGVAARGRPELPADAKAALWLTAILIAAAAYVVFVWFVLYPWAGSSHVLVLAIAIYLVPLVIYALPAYLRVRPHGAIGFYFGKQDWSLAVVLAAFAVIASFARNATFGIIDPVSAYVPLTLAAVPSFLVQSLNNGIPEETLFRGYLLPQLAAFLRRPWLAMLVMIVVFGLFHLPTEVAQSNVSPWLWALRDVFPLEPFALVVGYAYWRSRSLVPGIFLHTYITLWASSMFFSFR